LVIVEELDPVFEEQIRAMGLACYGKDIFPITGEYSVKIVREAAVKAGLIKASTQAEASGPAGQLSIPPRLPALCPGCPHRAPFYTLNKHKVIVPGDIGCYSIGVLPPFQAMDAIISMGASIGMAHGMKQAGSPDKLVAVIGDSTFFHTGLPALATVVYNNSPTTVMILDNGTTGMTGQQGNPASGQKLQPTQGTRIDIEAVVRAMGVRDVWKVASDDVKAIDTAVKEALAVTDRPTVILVEGKCVFIQGFQRKTVVEVDPETCNGCTLCFRVGCPAVLKSDELDEKTQRPKATIDSLLCTGCDVCLQVCPRHAIIHPQPQAD
jgi:indolepyruvate ferredoxin oxidoreductase alpha subunit